MSRRTSDPAPGVPRALAVARAAAIKRLRYDLTFDIPRSPIEPIRGTARIHVLLHDLSGPLVLDFRPGQEHLESVRVNDIAATGFRVANGHLIIPHEEGLVPGQNDVVVRFTSDGSTLNRRSEFLYTLFVPARAHWAFPCFDQPDLRACFQLDLTVPADWRVVANAAELARETTGGRTTIRFRDTEPIPTYLFAFAAGRFAIETAERDGRTLRMFHREPDIASVAAHRKAAFDLHASALSWLEGYTGIPYPFHKLDFILLPSFQFSGMEHPGAIYYNASSILVEDAPTEQQLLQRASLIAHETAHMWFGDLVTLKWFDDVWMKEMFANFMAAKIVEPAFPHLDHDLRFFLAHYPLAYSVDRTGGSHPIRQELDNLDEAGALYGPIIYQKAPIVMRLLERLIGEEVLQQGLRRFLRSFEFGNASWLDLVRVLGTVTNHDLASWSRGWVEEAGRPHIRVVRGSEETSTLIQSDPHPGRALLRRQELDVLVGDRSAFRHLSIATIDQSATLPTSETPVDFILPSAGGLGYGDFELDPESRSYLLEHTPNLAEPLSRASAWVTLWDEMLAGRLDPLMLANAALRGLRQESVDQNVQLLAGYLEEAFWKFLTVDQRHTLALSLESTLRDGIARARWISLRSTYFNAFRSIATTGQGVGLLLRVWQRRETIPGVPIRGWAEATLALALATRAGPDAAAILEKQLQRLASRDLAARFAFIMPAVSPEPSVRDQCFQSLANVSNRRHEPWVVERLTYLNHPLHSPASERYVRPALELLAEIRRTGDIFLPGRWMNATLAGHSSAAVASIVRNFLDERPDYPAQLRRIVLQAADGIFRIDAWRRSRR